MRGRSLEFGSPGMTFTYLTDFGDIADYIFGPIEGSAQRAGGSTPSAADQELRRLASQGEKLR
mgnify:CR=1 FL=1